MRRIRKFEIRNNLVEWVGFGFEGGDGNDDDAAACTRSIQNCGIVVHGCVDGATRLAIYLVKPH